MADPTPGRFRVGRSLGVTVYRGPDAEDFMGTMQSPEYAALVVDALNRAEVPSGDDGIDADGVEHVCEALMDVGGWDEIDGDGTDASIIADHIRRLPRVLADRAAEAPQPRVPNPLRVAAALGALDAMRLMPGPPGTDAREGAYHEVKAVLDGLLEGTRIVVIEDTEAGE